MFIFNTFSTCFGHHYAHLQEKKTCVTARGVLRWFCWMWLVAVVGRCLVGCEHCEIVENKHLTVASCWFSLSLHNLLTMHGHRNLTLDSQTLFHNKFYFMPLYVSSTCAHHQEVKIALHNLWYHHTYRCSKHVEA